MSSDNILVAVKSRPLIARETSEKLRPQWAVQDKTIFQIDEDGHRLSEPYSFDHIFTEYITNANVYNAVVESLVKSFLNGFNSTIFAYGQTSSGKTHTMMGTDKIPGIIQLAISDVFQHVSQDIQRRYLISCSYFELYNEKINDLLDKTGLDLKIREDYNGNTFINAKEEVVTQATEVYELMKIGSKIRKIGCTNMNERSSRSHTIFRLTIKSTGNEIEHGPVQVSYLNLVDLAGSERIAHTKAAGVRLKEGVNINKSLLALGNVIRQLSEGEGFINYRDSNLTRLLQHALGGNAKSLIIATITMAAGEETKSTLEFAQRAKVVKNKPIINEILSEQDKWKQNKLETANYKERLEKVMQEKEDREKEILKLKQQIKVIDLFTNGPQIKKTESNIPRRHTMGHYRSIPLQSIPECREISSGDGTTHDANDEELFLKRASQISDYDYMKIIIDESLDDGILSVTPEPLEELLVQEATTPTVQLRERLKYLEESYSALQEFTKLETQYKEDSNVIQDLIKEKENLLKDLTELNIIIKDARQENEQIKIKFEAEINALKNDLQYLKKKSDKASFALEQAEAERDALRLAKEQLFKKEKDEDILTKLYFLQDILLGANVDVQGVSTLTEETLITELTNEIGNLKKNNQSNEEKITDLLNQIENLEEENKNQKKKIEEVTLLNENIINLKDKIECLKETNQNCEDNILNYKVQIQSKDDDICELTTKIRKLEANMQSYMENIKSYKNEIDLQQSELVLHTEKITQMEKNINKYQAQLESKLKTVEDYDKEGSIEDLKKRIDLLMSDKKKAEKLIKNISNEKDIERKRNQELETRYKNMHLDNVALQTKIFDLENMITDLKSHTFTKNEDIINLKDKIEYLKKTNQNCEDKILNYKVQIQSNDNDICELTTKIRKLEADLQRYMENIKDYKNEIDLKQSEIVLYTEKIRQMEKDINKYQAQLELKTVEDYDKEGSIEDLKKRIELLMTDKKKAEKLIKNTSNEKDIERKRNQELETRYKNMHLDNVALQTKIFDLENVIIDLKSCTFTQPLEARRTRHSSASSSSMDLSPKELRKRRRQSIHDQRRGIDFAAMAATCSDEPTFKESSTTEKDLKEKLKQLKDKIEFLTSENDHLENEVQGFIRELDDCRHIRDEQDKEIDMLKEQIEKKQGQICKECPQKQHYIKKLEDLQRQNKFKIVELQTKIYDLQNTYQAEKDKTEEKERRLLFTIARFETKFGQIAVPKLNDAGIQCNIVNVEELQEKYSLIKKLARSRREEGNILRARLGMAPDEPVN